MKYRWINGIVLLSCTLSFAANAVLVGSTTIYINGTILPSSCIIATGGNTINVNLGSYANNTMKTVGQILNNGNSGTFDISLTGCNDGIIGTVVTLSGTEDKDVPGLLALSNPEAEMTAKGLAIQVKDNKDKLIPVNGKTALYPLLPGDNTLTFKLAYQVTRAPVYAGDANAVLYLDLAYQ